MHAYLATWHKAGPSICIPQFHMQCRLMFATMQRGWDTHSIWYACCCAGLLLLQRQMLAWQLLRELTVHILAEESVVYPVVAEQVSC
jgi:hypothetical protein